MKKTLLAMALSAAVAPAAFAQTNVTLYGIVDAGVEYAHIDGANIGGNALRVQPGIQSGNRWGLRGTEDLGGGLRAIFTLEAGFLIDEGSFIGNGAPGAGFGRRAFVGVEGGFGQVYLGRDYSPAFWVLLNSDRMQFGLYGNVSQMSQIQNTRVSNAITYVSPKFGGLSIRAQLGAGNEQFRNTGNFGTSAALGHDAGRFWGVAAEYAAGPLYVGAVYQRTNDPVVNQFTTANLREWGVGASYNFGVFGVNAGYFSVEPGRNTARAASYSESRAYWVGAGVKLGAGDLLAQVGQTRLDNIPTVGDREALTWGVAYTYPFSRRTNAYLAYGTVRNDGGTAVGLGTAGYVISPAATATNPRPTGWDAQALSLGVRHTF